MRKEHVAHEVIWPAPFFGGISGCARPCCLLFQNSSGAKRTDGRTKSGRSSGRPKMKPAGGCQSHSSTVVLDDDSTGDRRRRAELVVVLIAVCSVHCTRLCAHFSVLAFGVCRASCSASTAHKTLALSGNRDGRIPCVDCVCLAF